ncbi:hypothetical protein IZY60_09015 [Lutibacter sp. B2]|nr:hypothetical protein [Lutibacter sp. B2]
MKTKYIRLIGVLLTLLILVSMPVYAEENMKEVEINHFKEKKLAINSNVYLEESGYDKESYDYIYSIIVKGIKELKQSVEVDEFVKYDKGIDSIIKHAFNAYPETNYIDGVKYIYQSSNNRLKKLEFDYKYDLKTIKNRLEETDKKANEIIESLIKEDMTDFEKELAIHDYIIKNTQYDYENYNKNKIPYIDHTAYGVLVKGVGVCDGYSKAMKLLLNKAGIECIIVYNSDHAWNMVKIDNEIYHVDASYNDPVSKEDVDLLMYSYFNIPDEEISFDHEWNRDKYSKSSIVNDAYYKNGKGIVREVSSYYDFYKLIQKSAEEKQEYLFVKFPIEEEYNLEKIAKNVIENSKKNLGISYSVRGYKGAMMIAFRYNL